MVFKFFDKNPKGSGIECMSNQQLANELHKSIIRKCKKGKVYFSFKDNIWGVNLADIQFTSKYNKRIRYLLCVIDLFSNYALVVPLKDKKGVTIVNAFQNTFKKFIENQRKYGLIKEVNCITVLLKNG